MSDVRRNDHAPFGARERRIVGLVGLAIWISMSLLMTVQEAVFWAVRNSINSSYQPHPLHTLAWALASWVFWMPATFAIVRLAFAVPLPVRHWPAAIVLHASLAAVLGLAHALWMTVVTYLLGPIGDASDVGWVQGILLFALSGLLVEITLYATVLGGGLAYRAISEAHRREIRALQLETELGVAQVHALTAQIRPHFLFNALNTVSMMVRGGAQAAAVEALANLGDLLRSSLARGRTPLVPLSSELEFVEAYLALERVRFIDRLRVHIDVPAALQQRLVPTFILQPLVENAVHHGSSGPRASITVRGGRRDDWLEIVVQDDGPGPQAGWTWEQHAGVGLTNTRRRLQVLYGERFVLALERAPSGGALARLGIPWADDGHATINLQH